MIWVFCGTQVCTGASREFCIMRSKNVIKLECFLKRVIIKFSVLQLCSFRHTLWGGTDQLTDRGSLPPIIHQANYCKSGIFLLLKIFRSCIRQQKLISRNIFYSDFFLHRIIKMCIILHAILCARTWRSYLWLCTSPSQKQQTLQWQLLR